ncbi:major facilitator superfamily transporter [Colletotrichum karsti]|uniref:Major facilitator superfamily transporter n=1 Tax=Colletotrichum karsti TaxID=1095194 RepID=A0A9P6IG88_9PEZI|nr:major facilitator superfamily transporter [Colletotrichum karsti]KAF9881471.1 major facilitator superfamily transporter [Colletotrichum karsti]
MASSSPSKDNTKVDDADLAAVPSHINDGVQHDIDDAYLRATKFTKFWRSVLWQMILFGALSFVGPAMSDAISNLGGGGLSTPYLANLATSLNYAAGCLMTLFGGPLINKFGIKWSCMVAAVAMPLAGSAYYVNAKYDVDWYLLFARLIGGFTSGFLYVAETTAMLSYPKPNDRGFYLGIWSAMRNSGSVMGGAINFSTNYSKGSAGGIAWSTYLIFVAFECTGVIWAFLLSPTARVRRRDGSKIPMSPSTTWRREFAALWKHAQRKKTWLVFIPAFYSFFYGGTMGTYLSLHFSVRARALSSLIMPSVTIPLVIAYGKLLDTARWSQSRRAWISFAMWSIPQAACFVWIGIEYGKFGSSKPALDYELYGTPKDVDFLRMHELTVFSHRHGRRWAEAYIPYLIIFSTGYWTQLSLYWILGTFSTDVGSSSRTGGLFRAFETAGQAVSYAINTNSSADPKVAFIVNCAVLALTIPCMVFLIRLVPEAPADTDIDAGDLGVIDGVPNKGQTLAEAPEERRD